MPSWPPSPLQDAIHGAPYKVSLLQGQNSFVIFGSKKFGYNVTFKRILNALIFLFLSCGHEKLFFSSLERLTSWMHERLATADYRTLFSKFFPCYPAMAKVNASAQNLLSSSWSRINTNIHTQRERKTHMHNLETKARCLMSDEVQRGYEETYCENSFLCISHCRLGV